MYLLSKCEWIMKKNNASNFIIRYHDKQTFFHKNAWTWNVDFTASISGTCLPNGKKNRHRIRVSLLPQGYCGEGEGFQENPICPPLDFLQRVIDIKRGFHPVELLRHGTSDQGTACWFLDVPKKLRSKTIRKIHGTSEDGFQKTHLFKGIQIQVSGAYSKSK